MLCESCRDRLFKRGSLVAAAVAVALIAAGGVAARLPVEARPSAKAPSIAAGVPVLDLHLFEQQAQALAARRRARARRAERLAAAHQPHSRPRATISLYEHTVRRHVLRVQGCRAA